MNSDFGALKNSSANIDKIKTIIDYFKKKINILIIDDDLQIANILADDLFVSPLYDIMTVSTLKEACYQISQTRRKWHCWIVDINLKEGDNGSTLLDRFPDFNYAVIFSGASTLETASNALKKGAISAFSKDPAFLYYSDAFYNEVCKVSVISFILKGAHNEHLSIFQPLFAHVIETVEEWAHQAKLSTRQLQRICELYLPFSPRMFLPLYYALYYIARDPSFTQNFDIPTAEDLSIRNSLQFYLSSIDFVADKLSSVYNY